MNEAFVLSLSYQLSAACTGHGSSSSLAWKWRRGGPSRDWTTRGWFSVERKKPQSSLPNDPGNFIQCATCATAVPCTTSELAPLELERRASSHPTSPDRSICHRRREHEAKGRPSLPARRIDSSAPAVALRVPVARCPLHRGSVSESFLSSSLASSQPNPHGAPLLDVLGGGSLVIYGVMELGATAHRTRRGHTCNSGFGLWS